MWVMNATVPYLETNLVGYLTRKHKITLAGYPLSHSVKKNYVRIIMSGIFFGEKKDIASFCQDLGKDKRTLHLETAGTFGIAEMKQDIINRFLYQEGVIYVKPILVNKQGEYLFELASWEKQKLLRILTAYNKLNIKLNWIQQKKISNVQIVGVVPELTEKQRRCLELAIEHGYYGYPRKIDLTSLAKIAGISYSTFQFHLRVAEKKVMPTII